ncbi:unnamed protein product [Didymodactylos carnosus]|uniref:Amidase domain-containing protein n=1 Tax=Didymodactylos carnosus TaxID=1234261 RepID=A0A815S352_9BILA|nr:unnamed protein product [Didymodactylos carnosus]CAF4348080.1 unnamed protein product [Didymodactylos carnosus]
MVIDILVDERCGLDLVLDDQCAQIQYWSHDLTTAVINLLDWPAVALPVTFADKETDVNDATYKGISPLDTEIHNDYDADIYHGAPVSVQVIGRRLQEEYVIGLAEQIGVALSL